MAVYVAHVSATSSRVPGSLRGEPPISGKQKGPARPCHAWPSARSDLLKSGLPQIANVSVGGVETFSHQEKQTHGDWWASQAGSVLNGFQAFEALQKLKHVSLNSLPFQVCYTRVPMGADGAICFQFLRTQLFKSYSGKRCLMCGHPEAAWIVLINPFPLSVFFFGKRGRFFPPH